MTARRLSLNDLVREFAEYLNEFDAERNSVIISESVEFRTLYRQLTSLFIWVVLIRERRSTLQISRNAYARISEMLSDVMMATLLTSLGIYKPARMMLRSAIENFILYLCFGYGVRRKSDKRFPEIMSQLRDQPEASSNKELLNILGRLSGSYTELCKDVHTSTRLNMALLRNLGAIPLTDSTRFRNEISEVLRVARLINEACFTHLHSRMHLMHYVHRDFVLDSYGRELKRRVLDE